MSRFKTQFVPACILILGACSAGRNSLPKWVERPPESRRFIYAVGIRTDADTVEEARQGAMEQAVAELVRGFGVTSEASYEEVRTRVATEVRDQIQSKSGRVQIRDAAIEAMHLRRGATGYDAFVLVRYSRERAEQEKARLRSLDVATLHGALQARRRGDTARERGDVTAAIASYAEAAALAERSSDGALLRQEARERFSSVMSRLRIESHEGKNEAVLVPVGAGTWIPVWVSLDRHPAVGFPLRAVVVNGDVSFLADRAVTGDDGIGQIEIERVVSGSATIRVEPDIELLGRRLPADAGDEMRRVFEPLLARGAILHVQQDPRLRPVRVVVLIEEEGTNGQARHSFLAMALTEELRRAGFRVLVEQALGKTNSQVLRQAFDTERILSLHPALANTADVVIAGWCETRSDEQNHGWAVSALADAEAKAVLTSNGEVIATRSILGHVGFGERADRARDQAIQDVARELAKKLVEDLAASLDALAIPEPYWEAGR